MGKMIRVFLIALITFIVTMFCFNLVGLGIIAFYSSIQHFVLFLSLIGLLVGVMFEIKYHISL